VSYHLEDWLNLQIEEFESVNGDPLKKFDLPSILTTKTGLCQQNTFSYTKAKPHRFLHSWLKQKDFAFRDFGASSALEILVPLLSC
jgi:hypothetical protein